VSVIVRRCGCWFVHTNVYDDLLIYRVLYTPAVMQAGAPTKGCPECKIAVARKTQQCPNLTCSHIFPEKQNSSGAPTTVKKVKVERTDGISQPIEGDSAAGRSSAARLAKALLPVRLKMKRCYFICCCFFQSPSEVCECVSVYV
jgi:hypothetical protein